MAEKRKASSRRTEVVNGDNLDVEESRKRIRDFEDVADSDDEFHINRDKILLDEEPEAKRRRKWDEQEEFLQASDEEVLGDSSEDEEYENTGASVGKISRQDRRNGPTSTSDTSDDGSEEENDDDDGWAMSKGDIYGADEIETEEQALEEEAEALRLQKKQLQSMDAADYGFDEAEWQGGGLDQATEDEDEDNIVTEVLPQLQISDETSPAERLKILKTRYPEFEPLSKELLALKELHAKLQWEAQQHDFGRTSNDYPNATTKFRAASAYLGSLTMYFALLTSSASVKQGDAIAMAVSKLRDHPVMNSLVQCRELWLRARSLPDDTIPTARELDTLTHDNGLKMDTEAPSRIRNVANRPVKQSRAQRHAEALMAAEEARKADRLQRAEAGLADLDSLVASAGRRKSSKNVSQTLDRGQTNLDLGEEAPLTAQEAADKAKRKKSLRFYTSQIAQKANKRGTAGRNAGGDEDIPYRERLKDRQFRLNGEAEKRGQRNAKNGVELGGESDEEDARQAREVREGNEDDDLYDLVAARTAKKKADKAAFAEAQRQAALQGGQAIAEATVGADGKRKITYAIEKNKGLTPHRKKEVRNPRVKKRKKFDEKKKKLASIKPVYKGGEGRGGYGGELTGIKKGLVKSTKL